MCERLILCEYALADLTMTNGNVFYELGLRHAVRSFSTVLLFAKSTGQLPFDGAPPLRSIPYGIGADGKSDNVTAIAPILTDRFKEAHKYMTDSPVYQLVEGFPEIRDSRRMYSVSVRFIRSRSKNNWLKLASRGWMRYAHLSIALARLRIPSLVW